MDNKLKLKQTLSRLEADYNRYRQPEVMQGLKGSTFDKVWDVFSGSIVKPEAAPFVVGRIYQALEPYREAVFTIAEYEKAESALVEAQKREDDDAILDRRDSGTIS